MLHIPELVQVHRHEGENYFLSIEKGFTLHFYAIARPFHEQFQKSFKKFKVFVSQLNIQG